MNKLYSKYRILGTVLIPGTVLSTVLSTILMNSRNLRSDEEGKDPKVKEQMTVMSPAEPWTVELTETVIEDPQGGQDVTVDQGDS